MESLIALALLGGVGWLGFRMIAGTGQFFRSWNNPVYHPPAPTRRELQQQEELLRRLYRQMQEAILHLDREPDPDFRRAASAAQQARAVPPDFRQRQYHRFRPLLVQHFQSCLRRGTSRDILIASLTELVEAMGMPGFEADYIRQEVDRTTGNVPPIPTGGDAVQDFQAQLLQVQEEHTQRVEAIRGLASIDEEIRNQLLEAEERRFQQALFGRE
ncbi:MAG: hypothetical protein R3C01_02175 [Planctomycetaceae bacterium]